MTTLLNSARSIGIEIVYGARSVDEDDRDRARQAAADSLNAAGVRAEDAFAAYKDQWEEFDDEDQMHGLALAWIAARSAADIALTEGWADPNGASCSIYA